MPMGRLSLLFSSQIVHAYHNTLYGMKFSDVVTSHVPNAPCLYWATEKRPLSTFNGPEYEIISETEANHYTPCKDCQTNVPPAKFRVGKRASFEDRAPCKIEA